MIEPFHRGGLGLLARCSDRGDEKYDAQHDDENRKGGPTPSYFNEAFDISHLSNFTDFESAADESSSGP